MTAFGQSGDVLFLISTSGNSANCVKAAQTARKQGVVTVALTGSSGGKLKAVCDHTLNVDSEETPHIQEAHIMLIHLICGIIEKRLMEAGYFDEK